ncbi:MAG: FtsW/RodA/SpoVE family cell cycle protein [Telluria sp.]
MNQLLRPATSAALLVLCLLQLVCLLRAPAAWSPGQIRVQLARGASIQLGREELAAPAANRSALVLRRDAAGGWWVRAGSGAPLRLQDGGQTRRTGMVTLVRGSRFQLGREIFTVTSAGADGIDLASSSHRWHFDGATVRRDGGFMPPCPDARWSSRLLWAWNRYAPALVSLVRPLTLGGNLDCGSRVGVGGTDPAAASISLAATGPVLSAAWTMPVLLFDSPGTSELAAREESLDHTAAITVGRTRFLVSPAGDALQLRPASHVALFEQPHADLPPQVSWSWQPRHPWRLALPSGWAVFAAVALAVAGLCGWSAARAHASSRILRFAAGAAGPLIACAGVAALGLQRLGSAPGTGCMLVLAGSALWYALLAPRRINGVAAAAVLLLAIGMLAQLELGLGAAESSWLRHVDRTAAVCAVGLGLGVRFAISGLPAPTSRRSFETVLLSAAALALVALALQVALGGETGVFDLQPVEFAKLILAALCAYCLALGAHDGARGALLHWLRLLAPAVLFVALLGVALVQVDDYSPLVLLMLWSGVIALAWALALRRRVASLALAGAACAAVFAVAGLRTAGAEEARHLNFYGDRFQVWLDPATHPHTGRQLLLGARAIADGGWIGADHAFGLASLGQPAGDVLRVPAVQDDFAPTFFANRHGLLGVLALWLLQACLVTALLRAAVRAWLAGKAMPDYRNAWHARFRCFTLCGGAAFLFGHFLLSWGTNLAIFPVMGQPMSFLSAGGSHLLFFICPLLAFGIASDQH